MELNDKKQKAYEEKLIGKTVEVLVEGVSKNNPKALQGRTPENKIVNFYGDKELTEKYSE